MESALKTPSAGWLRRVRDLSFRNPNRPGLMVEVQQIEKPNKDWIKTSGIATKPQDLKEGASPWDDIWYQSTSYGRVVDDGILDISDIMDRPWPPSLYAHTTLPQDRGEDFPPFEFPEEPPVCERCDLLTTWTGVAADADLRFYCEGCINHFRNKQDDRLIVASGSGWSQAWFGPARGSDSCCIPWVEKSNNLWDAIFSHSWLVPA